MSAETLRRAAADMRERAEAVDGWYGAKAWATTAPFNLPIEKADAEHIASWHPAVALAVADWLDYEAARLTSLDKHGLFNTAQATTTNALAVARAYLGEQP